MTEPSFRAGPWAVDFDTAGSGSLNENPWELQTHLHDKHRANHRHDGAGRSYFFTLGDGRKNGLRRAEVRVRTFLGKRKPTSSPASAAAGGAAGASSSSSLS